MLPPRTDKGEMSSLHGLGGHDCRKVRMYRHAQKGGMSSLRGLGGHDCRKVHMYRHQQTGDVVCQECPAESDR